MENWRVTDFGKFVVFKPVSGGYVYRAPNAWLFGTRDHYLANDAQKGEILAAITSSGRPVLWIMGLSWITLCLLMTAGSLLWAHRLGYRAPGLSAVLVMIVMTFSVYAAMLISRQLLLFRLRPILATLQPTSERITNLEERQAWTNAAPTATLSPARQKVVRIACGVGLAAILGVLISRTIDMAEQNHSILLALYNANANFSGLFNIVAIVGFGFAFVRLGRSTR